MKGNEFLFNAIGEIDDELIISAAESIGSARPKIQHRKILRTVLIAAVVTVLLATAAFALDIFGLQSHSAALAVRTAQHVPDEPEQEYQFVFTRGEPQITEQTDAEEYLTAFLSSGEYQASYALSREYNMIHGWESESSSYFSIRGDDFENRAQELAGTYGLVPLFDEKDELLFDRSLCSYVEHGGHAPSMAELFDSLWQGCFVGEELFPAERKTLIYVTISTESIHSAMSISNEKTDCRAYAMRHGCMMLTQDEADLKISAIDSAWQYSANGCLVCCGTQDGVGSLAVYETEWGWYMLYVDGGREELESALNAMDFTQTR